MDAEVNLVPFIDLLSCCICFLLISAVWTSVAKIDVKAAPNMPADAPPPEEPKVKLTVHIRGTGYFLSDGGSMIEMPKVSSTYPVKELHDKLAAVRQAFPEVTGVTVMSDDDVPYKDLVTVMDNCLQVGLADISVAGS